MTGLGILRCAESGRKSLFRGIGPSLLRAVPAAASTFAAFELTRGGFAYQTGLSLTLRFTEYIIDHDLL
jgi:hypothetical protein